VDKHKAALTIIEKALPLAPFEGWNHRTLSKAAIEAGYKRTDVIRVFPGGAIGAAQVTMRHYDSIMSDAMREYHLDTMKIRIRIATAIRLKLEAMTPHREGVRKIIALLSLPHHAPVSLRLLYETVDTIWHEIGDTSTDFNFYTKRLLLAAVYSSTLLYWLDDKSQGFSGTWDFLDRRIEDVMKIEKIKHTIKTALS
jgi:ubiquinone biosynthesis protein COQ9